jgi:predicted alpha/beta hydrolase
LDERRRLRPSPGRRGAALLQLYPAAPSELKRVTPAEVGAARIGHFGFFREQFRDTLWREAADWLLRH